MTIRAARGDMENVRARNAEVFDESWVPTGSDLPGLLPTFFSLTRWQMPVGTPIMIILRIYGYSN
jgi:hypothetical protein